MKNLLLVLFGLFLTAASATAQTIIDLEKGGKVRAKTIDDYKAEARMAEIARRDSVAYVGLVRSGFTSLAADSLNEAEENLKRAIKLRPDAPGNHVLRYNLALIEMARGESKKAEKTLTDILKKHPDYVDARLARGEAYLQNGKDAEAVEDAKKVLESDEEISREMKARAHFVCAAGYYAAHRFVEAESELLQHLRLRPGAVCRIAESAERHCFRKSRPPRCPAHKSGGTNTTEHVATRQGGLRPPHRTLPQRRVALRGTSTRAYHVGRKTRRSP